MLKTITTVFGVQDLAQIQFGIRKEAKYFDGTRDWTSLLDAGFPKILARDAGNGEKFLNQKHAQ